MNKMELLQFAKSVLTKRLIACIFVKKVMAKEGDSTMLNKGIYTGTIEKDENGNFFCGQILLDYKMVTSGFSVGDLVTVKTVIVNPSDMTYNQYPKKSRNFALANRKPEQN